MRPGTSTIDRPAGAARGFRGPWTTVVLGAAILGLVYASGVNRNALELSLLFSACVILSAVVTRAWSEALLLGACAYLASVPVRVPDLGPLYPAPRNVPGKEGLWVTPMGRGETWTYPFELVGLGAGGAAGHLYVDGRDLSGLVVTVQGKTLSASAYSAKKNGLDHIAIPLDCGSPGPLVVSLSALPGAAPRIFHGPEVHGFDVYGDAVWLEFDRGADRFIYQAKRTEAKPSPQRSPD